MPNPTPTDIIRYQNNTARASMAGFVALCIAISAIGMVAYHSLSRVERAVQIERRV